jgi:hypothetical protein
MIIVALINLTGDARRPPNEAIRTSRPAGSCKRKVNGLDQWIHSNQSFLLTPRRHLTAVLAGSPAPENSERLELS